MARPRPLVPQLPRGPVHPQDSGGFQMVSLVSLSEVTEEGVRFRSPYNGEETVLSPERSVEIQNALGEPSGKPTSAPLSCLAECGEEGGHSPRA